MMIWNSRRPETIHSKNSCLLMIKRPIWWPITVTISSNKSLGICPMIKLRKNLIKLSGYFAALMEETSLLCNIQTAWLRDFLINLQCPTKLRNPWSTSYKFSVVTTLLTRSRQCSKICFSQKKWEKNSNKIWEAL